MVNSNFRASIFIMVIFSIVLSCDQASIIIPVDLNKNWYKDSEKYFFECCSKLDSIQNQTVKSNLKILSSNTYRQTALNLIIDSNSFQKNSTYHIDEIFNMGSQYFVYRIIVFENKKAVVGYIKKMDTNYLIPLEIDYLENRIFRWKDSCCIDNIINIRHRPLIVQSKVLTTIKGQLKVEEIVVSL